MTSNDIRIMTEYISSWCWHLIAIMFLCTLVIVIVLQNFVFTVALALLIAGSEFMALKRKKELLNEESNN